MLDMIWTRAVGSPRPDRQCRYSARTQARLWRRKAGPAVAALALGLALGGCSFSYKLGSFFGKDEPDQTASIPPAPNKTAGELPPDGDLAYARAAVNELLARGGGDASMPWENPTTGARGTVTPIANAYTQDGFTCRDFIASYLHDGAESWLQGAACRIHQGKWEVRTLRPWKRA